MQTEETNPETLDEVPILNPQSDIEMTVKEEIDHPVELAEKRNVLLNECMSTESSSRFISVDDHHSFQDSAIGHRFNGPFDNIRQVNIPLQRERLFNNSHEYSTSNSTLPHSVASTTISSSLQKNEKERGRGKRRSRWKLKFHHQALPPEYLDHYEASMAQQEAAAAAAAAKSANIKTDSKNKGSGTTTTKSSPLSAKSTSVDKTDKLMLSSTQCFIKTEQESSKYDTSLSSGNTNVLDHLHILPIQTLSINDDNDSSSKMQDEISIVKEKANPSSGKGQLNNERSIAGKGLLGTLLTSTVTSEVNNRTATDNERKRKSVIMSTSTGNTPTNATISRSPTPTNNSNTSNNKVRNYQDLPYMGEITLDNMKPRRGRKPKKADICHLIYKNYGTTVFPAAAARNNTLENEEWSKRKVPEVSQGNALPSLTLPDMRLKQENYPEPSLKCKSFESLKQCSPVSHSDVQNRIISSLLEKRLMTTTQDGKKTTYSNACFPSNTSDFERNEDTTINNHDSWSENCKRAANVNEEPLNLCVKDLNQLKIRLLRKHGNFYEPRANDVIIKSEPPSPSTSQETDTCDIHNDSASKLVEVDTIETVRSQMNLLLHRTESDRNCDSFTFPPTDCSRATTPAQIPEETIPSGASSLPGGYIYWPSAGVFVHPMALQSQFLYYQKMGAIPLVPLSPAETQTFMPSHVPHVNLIPHVNTTLPQNSTVTTQKSVQKKEIKSSINKALIPKAFSMMMDTSPKTSIPSTEVPFSRLKRLAPLGNPPTTTTTPTKRKRSAIFIPPMPSENSTNPTTEVSICKFKFTGGAKPSLQEKKMLSVDSGGNFRYYSGTGDKSMRGYEFFPRETLQQSGTSGGTSSEQFLAASAVGSSDKIVGNTLTFIPEENKSLHLQHLSGTTDQSSKVEIVNVPSAETENGMGGSSSQNYEHQTQSGCVRKKTDFLTKGRNVSVSGESEQPVSSCKEDDQSTNSQVRIRRKRKTRKSLAREKLEQTFKEKGFLIQTQQLESAEGATYCKFRQLRKFTRYLFRSWKDYLPGNVREMSVAAGVAGPETSPSSEVGQPESEIDGEVSCSNSPTPTIQHTSESAKSFPSM